MARIDPKVNAAVSKARAGKGAAKKIDAKEAAKIVDAEMAQIRSSQKPLKTAVAARDLNAKLSNEVKDEAAFHALARVGTDGFKVANDRQQQLEQQILAKRQRVVQKYADRLFQHLSDSKSLGTLPQPLSAVVRMVASPEPENPGRLIVMLSLDKIDSKFVSTSDDGSGYQESTLKQDLVQKAFGAYFAAHPKFRPPSGAQLEYFER